MDKIKGITKTGIQDEIYYLSKKFKSLSRNLRCGSELYGKKDNFVWINKKPKQGNKEASFYTYDNFDFSELNRLLDEIDMAEAGMKAQGYDLSGVKSFNRNIWADLSRESNSIEGIYDDFSYDLLDFRAKIRGKFAVNPSTKKFERYGYYKKLHKQIKAVEMDNDSRVVVGKKQSHILSMDTIKHFVAFKYAYVCAMQSRFSRDKETKSDLLDMIQNVEGLLSGQEICSFRNDQAFIGKDEEIRVHWIPAKPEEIKERMEALCDWATSKSGNNLHPIVKAAIFHAEFIHIHPFRDGNGRVGRIMSNYELMQHEIPTIAIKNIDKDAYFLAENKAICSREIDDLIKLFYNECLKSAKIVKRCLEYTAKRQNPKPEMQEKL